MKPKPTCLGPEYAAQFEDESVARAYKFRAPYPAEVFAFLGSLQPDGPGRVLELGCGSGDVTIGLAPYTRSIDAVDPSDAMLAVARQRQGEASSRIGWHACSAESFPYRGPYSLVVAAASLHWMDWAVVLPSIASSTMPEAWLAIVDKTRAMPRRLGSAVSLLIPRYSTNQDYQPFDVVQHLTERGMFEEMGRQSFGGYAYRQPVGDYIESIHSQNGFSRDRMSKKSADVFDGLVRQLARPHAKDGALSVQVEASVVWGRARDA